jgi:hypothetical protein
MEDARLFYPSDGEYPDEGDVVTGFWDGEDFGQAKVTPDGEGSPLWFRKDDDDWVLCDEPVCWKENNDGE